MAGFYSLHLTQEEIERVVEWFDNLDVDDQDEIKDSEINKKINKALYPFITF